MRYVALTLVFSMRHATVQVDEHFHQLTSSRLVLAAIIACLRCRVRHRDALHQDCGRDRDAHGSQASRFVSRRLTECSSHVIRLGIHLKSRTGAP